MSRPTQDCWQHPPNSRRIRRRLAGARPDHSITGLWRRGVRGWQVVKRLGHNGSRCSAQCSLHLVGRVWHRTQTGAGCVKHRVRDRRRHHGCTRLTGAPGLFRRTIDQTAPVGQSFFFFEGGAMNSSRKVQSLQTNTGFECTEVAPTSPSDRAVIHPPDRLRLCIFFRRRLDEYREKGAIITG